MQHPLQALLFQGARQLWNNNSYILVKYKIGPQVIAALSLLRARARALAAASASSVLL
jgi:hypothetical protein